MLQAHSLLWHYLWIAPYALNLALGLVLWRRGLQRSYPLFFCYLIVVSIEELVLYGFDLSSAITWKIWWCTFWAGTIAEGLLKFAVVGELFHHLLRSWPALAKLGSNLVAGAGALLLLLATLAAAFTTSDYAHWLVSGGHILMQTVYIIEAGLILSLFLFAGYFRLPWERFTFGIALGFAVVWCEHLAAWAVLASRALTFRRELLDFLNMATYHVSVLVWFYYLLVPQKMPVTSSPTLPETNLDLWNRELERLLQP
jgi:uncharacterized membrane protein YsdA (DUF1294 family)